MIINNANAIPLNQNFGTLPYVGDGLLDYFQTLTFNIVTKAVVNFKVIETLTPIIFQGCWQPFTPEKLEMRPRGQRSWEWFWLHAQPGVLLRTDDIITYLGNKFRVMDKKDYSPYGYLEYHLVNDYVAAGAASGDSITTESGQNILTESGIAIVTEAGMAGEIITNEFGITITTEAGSGIETEGTL